MLIKQPARQHKRMSLPAAWSLRATARKSQRISYVKTCQSDACPADMPRCRARLMGRRLAPSARHPRCTLIDARRMPGALSGPAIAHATISGLRNKQAEICCWGFRVAGGRAGAEPAAAPAAAGPISLERLVVCLASLGGVAEAQLTLRRHMPAQVLHTACCRKLLGVRCLQGALAETQLALRHHMPAHVISKH